MCDKTDSRHAHTYRQIRGQGSHQIAVGVESDIFKPELFELFLEVFGEYHLPGGRRGHICQFVALSVKFDVFEKTFYKCHFILD